MVETVNNFFKSRVYGRRQQQLACGDARIRKELQLKETVRAIQTLGCAFTCHQKAKIMLPAIMTVFDFRQKQQHE
jgi:hypothetical protein